MKNIDQIIKTLTLDEKVSLLSGFNSWYTNKIEKKNIPSIKMSDGPNGVRGDSNSGKSSACFPCAISIGSTWDLSLIKDIGIALGEEAQAKDVDVLLGPTINIHRHPLGGRHFESFSEDPFLTGKIATNYVQGVQSKNVAACLKHFVGNDTEYERHSISSNIDAQTLREIYLLPFEMGIKEGNAKVVMSAYNNIKKLAVIGPNALEAQIIGGGSASLRPHYQIHPLEAAQERLGHETEILYSKGCHTHKYLPKINEELMEEKDGFLVEYFDGNQFDKNLILEERLTGSKFWVFEGFAKDVISKEERPDISVRFSCTYKPDISGLHEFEIFGIGKCRLLIDGNELIDNWTSMDPGEAFFTFGSASKKGVINLQKGEAYKIEVQYKFEGSFPAVYIGCQAPDEVDIFQEALETASHADDVILIVGTNSDWETEGNDRADFNLPANQNKLIEAILEANQNTVVVINTGSPIHMPWEKKAKAIIQTWFAGQEFGNALVDILSGEVNPSGKLPTTFPVKIEDTPAYKNYPGKNLQMNYDEKLLVGHRWYESNSIKPLFCFGHGLSFTSFNYQNLEVTTGSDFVVTCKFEIQNTGDISGLEIAQCYVGFASPLPGEPYKTLQGFVKEEIGANELKKVEIKLGPRNFSFWSVETNTWQIREGSYQILIGSSSENILLQANINLEQALEVR
jgi:beta-glucosidase